MTNTEKLKQIVDNVESNKFTIHFFVLDTNGNIITSILNMYRQAKILHDNGYDVNILCEKENYVNPLIDEVGELKHSWTGDKTLKINIADIIVIPEIFGNLMESLKDYPCRKVVLCNSYTYMLETLSEGTTWTSLGISDVITTNKTLSDFVGLTFMGHQFYEIPIAISDEFKRVEAPKPIVSMYFRNAKDEKAFVKTFYLKYPAYRWISFRSLKGLTHSEFAEYLSDSMLSVWFDEESSFGTFPLESMKCGVPCVGVKPYLTQDWMSQENGVWLEHPLGLADVVATMIDSFLKSGKAYHSKDDGMRKAIDNNYTMEQKKEKTLEVYGNIINNNLTRFQNELKKITVNTSNKTAEEAVAE